MEFVGHVFKTLSTYIGAQWSESIDKLALAMNQAQIDKKHALQCLYIVNILEH